MTAMAGSSTSGNSSVAGLQNVLATWEAFVGSGKSDTDDDYEDYVEDVIERARQSDPRVFGPGRPVAEDPVTGIRPFST